MPIAATMASVPALQANSKSAPCVLGTAPIASATMVEVGLTAYGCDSDPTQTARNSVGSIWARSMALRAASMDMVITSSSRPGTAFSLMGSPLVSACPYAGDFLGGQTITRHIRAVADNANRLDGFEEGGGGLCVEGLSWIIPYCNSYQIFCFASSCVLASRLLRNFKSSIYTLSMSFIDIMFERHKKCNKTEQSYMKSYCIVFWLNNNNMEGVVFHCRAPVL